MADDTFEVKALGGTMDSKNITFTNCIAWGGYARCFGITGEVNKKISDVAFRYCQPFDTVIVEDENGNEKREMYIMHFIHWLMVELKKYGAENKSAMDKHLAKYSK